MQSNTATNTVSTIVSLVAPSAISYTLQYIGYSVLSLSYVPSFPLILATGVILWIVSPFWIHASLTPSQATNRYVALAIGIAGMIIRLH